MIKKRFVETVDGHIYQTVNSIDLLMSDLTGGFYAVGEAWSEPTFINKTIRDIWGEDFPDN